MSHSESRCRWKAHRSPWNGFPQYALLLVLLAVSPAAQAQRRDNAPLGASDLALQNLNHVAASSTQIEKILRKDAGLMVELKDWVAKDATDHGQIVSDSDLTDQAIYDRLTTDAEFRAVATRLLQRYGYLIPKLNPDSQLAKEQDLLLKERANRLMRAEAEAPAPRSAERGFEQARSCEPELDPGCAEQEPSQPERRRAQADASGVPPEANPPELRELPTRPQAPGYLLEEAQVPSRQLVQAAIENGEGTGQRFSQRPNLPPSSIGGLEAGNAEVALPPRTAASEENRGTLPQPASGPEAYRRTGTLAGSKGMERREDLSRPPMIHRADPYANIPSLYDMYMQVSTQPPELKRFGQDVFRDGTRDSNLIPMDLPVGPDYVVGPGDGLAIDLWGGVSQRLYRSVDREGRLALPEVGPVLVSGRTLGEVQQAVQQILRTQFRDISADVSLSRLRTIRVYVVGDVGHAGAYDISSLSTPLNALFVAGGPTSRGSLRILRHYRGRQLVQDVDVYDLLLHGVKSDIQRLENGDTVLVPPIGPQATIEGMVRRPAIYELRDEKTLADALQLAGGILPTATLRHIEVQRVEAHQKRTMLSLNIPDGQDSDAVNKQLESFTVRDGDEVRIFPIAPYNQDAIYLEGHVLRPGRYSYRDGMKLTDLIATYADLMPEPAPKYAEIIRLNPPDYRPSVESFDLGAALAHPAAAPVLHPLDTVRIFSRYDFENPPTVTLWGEVRKPGTYRTSGQIHLRDAIELARGLKPDALMQEAQVFSYLPDSTMKVTSVNLGQALAGNPLDNILLQPRDRILVHSNPAKVDPASVHIKGEVTRQGRYPLTANMRVADLVRLGGGFKRSADTETADLTQYLVQDSKQQWGEHHEINIAGALAGDPNQNLLLHDGDTLTIRQIPGWNDIGAYVVVRGEVQHPGTYGIRPSERLSSVLARAGGFSSTAYPQGMVFERDEVRTLQEKSKQELIQRIQQEAASFKTSLQQSAQEQVALQQAAVQQRQREIEALQQTPATGRMVVRLRNSLAEFKESTGDIEVRAGDTVYVPKRPEFVVVTGQVYNSNAVTFVPHRNAGWYLRQAGGPTDQANRKAIFIIRANGSVVSAKAEGWWSGSVLSAQVEPGDTIVVPEKAIGGSALWKNLLSVAQIAQSASIAALVATR